MVEYVISSDEISLSSKSTPSAPSFLPFLPFFPLTALPPFRRLCLVFGLLAPPFGALPGEVKD